MIPQNRRITIKHVAREAGVSTQTISRVINNRPDVSPETRQRVLEIIDRLGYQPSELARSLIHHRSATLGVVIAGLRYIGPSRTLNGITSKAEELGYMLLLKELPRFTTEETQSLVHSLLARHVDGILWAVPEVGDNRCWVDEILHTIPTPIIFLTMQARTGISSVSIDNYAGGVLATKHLLEQGRCHVGHLAGPQDWWEARQRKQAWLDTLGQAGIQATAHHWAEGNWSSASGEVAFEQLLKSYPDMDAVFAANDQMALSVLQLAYRRGLKIPEQLAVVGFDNFAESTYFMPSLTTINHNHHELGCRAVQELVEQIEKLQRNDQCDPVSISLLPELVVRNSSVVDLNTK